MSNLETQILTMSETELDAVPVGIIQLDRNAKILYYNKSQAKFARRTSETTVGLNFFHDVAPCAAVQAFQGRFDEFVSDSTAKLSESFDFVFAFPWGSRKVAITFVRSGHGSETYFVVVSVAQ